MKTKQLLVLLSSIAMISACQNDELPDVQVSKTTLPETTTIQALALDEDVTEEQALDVANQFLKKPSAQTRSAEAAATVEKIADGGETLIYAINYEGGGYALVSAKTTYYPVLAYSEEGKFTYKEEDMHPGLKDWIDFQEKIISGEYTIGEEDQLAALGQWQMYLGVNENPEEVSPMAAQSEAEAYAQRVHEIGAKGYHCVSLAGAQGIFSNAGASLTYESYVNLAKQYNSPLNFTIVGFKEISQDNEIGPLLTTEWHQYSPFNDLSKANDYPTGCVTIAMAQIMKYHQHPAGYNWGSMPSATASQDTKLLIKDITEALGISYSSSNSDVSIGKANDVFSDKFQYNVTQKGHDYTDVKNAISRKEPVFMTGKESVGSGHAWVCDGSNQKEQGIIYFIEYRSGSSGSYSYKSDGTPNIDSPYTISRGTLYFHMNWGYPLGDENGWYGFQNVSTSKGTYDGNRRNLYVTPR